MNIIMDIKGYISQHKEKSKQYKHNHCNTTNLDRSSINLIKQSSEVIRRRNAYPQSSFEQQNQLETGL